MLTNSALPGTATCASKRKYKSVGGHVFERCQVKFGNTHWRPVGEIQLSVVTALTYYKSPKTDGEGLGLSGVDA